MATSLVIQMAHSNRCEGYKSRSYGHVFSGTTATNIATKVNLTYAEAAQANKNLLVASKRINK